MTPVVQQAIRELEATFSPATLHVEEDGNGGARVLVESVPLCDLYAQSESWIGGHILAQTPYADVYPLFVRGDLQRVDGRALGDGMAPGHMFMNRPSIQVSRRSNGRDPAIEMPVLKFLKVLEWLRTRN
jgi:hypothetical protein